ncbi:MAG: hypothetical protein JNL03_10105 [Prolixibacteraceae bacterium]|nr:hypothetical protein [Prolixibacteraceae bacterium]
MTKLTLNKMMKKYLQEIWFLKYYIVVVVLAIGFSYSVYYFLDPETVAYIGDEDHFFEWATAISLFLSFSILLTLFLKTKNIFYLFLSVLFFWGAGEEVSWGQRIIGFKTPELMQEINVQNELSLHNIEIFNTHDFQQNTKKGFARLLEINFLFRIFMMCFGILLPFLAYHSLTVRKLTEWAKLPIPPISIGIFFLINWITFRILFVYVLSPQHGIQYLDTDSEIFECLGAFIFFVISAYFYLNRERIIPGKDIKTVI